MGDAEVVRSLTELLMVAKVAMPGDQFAGDPRILRARRLVTELAHGPSVTKQPAELEGELATSSAMTSPPWDITAGLDAFMATDLAPENRTEATILIIRDWLVGHGYIRPTPEPEETN